MLEVRDREQERLTIFGCRGGLLKGVFRAVECVRVNGQAGMVSPPPEAQSPPLDAPGLTPPDSPAFGGSQGTAVWRMHATQHGEALISRR